MRTRHFAALSATLIGVGLSSMPTANAADDLPRSYEVAAEADGLRMASTIPGAPLSDSFFDVSTTSTRAVVDALGVSRSFAALPYPGATMTNLPDLARGNFGAPVGSYPFIASADYPTVPQSNVAQPGTDLTATSAEDRSEASATMGEEAGGTGHSAARSVAATTPDGRLTAKATSVVDGLTVGPLVIGRVSSVAEVVRDGTGPVRRTQSLEVTGANVGGQAIDVAPDGLRVGGTAIPLPDSGPMRAALEQAGITVQYLQPVETPDGILGAGLLITQALPVSGTGAPSQLTYALGRARAQAVVGAAGVAPTGAATGSNTRSRTDDQSDLGRGEFVPPADVATKLSPPEASAPSIPLALAPADSALPVAADTQTFAPTAAGRVTADAWPGGVAGVPASAGLLVLGLFLAIRYLGVRSTWR